jgi:hypothetical protein
MGQFFHRSEAGKLFGLSIVLHQNCAIFFTIFMAYTPHFQRFHCEQVLILNMTDEAN